MAFQHRFSCHRRRKTAQNSPRTRGSLLPLLDFVIVLRAQLPVRQGTAALPKLRPKPWVMRQHGCRPQGSHPRCQSRTSPSSTAARFCAHMGLPPRQLIPLIVDPAERTGDDNKSAATAPPRIQRHIRRDRQRQDGTQSTSSRASREGDKVAMSPDGGDTSPPTELPAGDGSVALQCANCCAPQTQLRPTSGRDSDASIDATPLTDNRPPPAFAPSGAPIRPGTSTTIGSSNTPCVQ
jgi:hypothetical protein